MTKYVTTLSLCLAFALMPRAYAQKAAENTAAEHAPFPIENYEEPADPATTAPTEWNGLEERLYATWASRDVHYSMHSLPQMKIKADTTMYVWRGERANMEALLFAPVGQGTISLRMTPMRNTDGDHAEYEAAEARFMRYVITDGFKACGNNPMNTDTYLVPDIIDRDAPLELKAMEVRPVWCTLEIPYDAEPGTYALTLDVCSEENGEILANLNLKVHIREHTLPRPADQNFHLDLWQQPYAVSRYYGKDIYSEEHLEALRPYLRMLARAGQRVATTILFYEPWGVQSHDKFEPMVETILNEAGEWEYRYDRFDAYVKLCEECGINRQINCYSMIPWEMKFRYFDAKTQTYQYIAADHSSEAYRTLWRSFLEAFGKHLKEKGWFEKTCLAMDERGLDAMKSAYKIAQDVLPGIKMALAGVKHQDFATVLYDYSIALDQEFTPEQLAERKAKGYITTAYTSCADPQPNIFTNSEPAEAAYIPLYCLTNGLDGYLHWSWMNWHDTPLTDSRFRMFAPGDTYSVYPGCRTGVRFERLIEGIQQYEKVVALRKLYTENGDHESLETLEAALERFKSGKITYYESAASLVNIIEALLNDAPMPEAEEVTEYCPTTLSASKRDIALEKRWVTSAKSTGAETDIDYSASQPSATGYVVTPETLTVKAGSKFSLRVKTTQNDDDLRYCRAALFADWNRDFIFNTEGNELLARRGNANQANTALLNALFSVSVPADATPGESRLRLVYADAWADEPYPCGELMKGFAIDIPMLITDEATATAPVQETPHYRFEGSTLRTGQPMRLYIYNASGTIVDRTDYTDRYSFSQFMPGTYIIKGVDDLGKTLQLEYLVTRNTKGN